MLHIDRRLHEAIIIDGSYICPGGQIQLRQAARETMIVIEGYLLQRKLKAALRETLNYSAAEHFLARAELR